MRISEDVLGVLSAMEFSGSAAKLKGQLDRRLYLKANEVLEAAGCTWNRKAQSHLFPAGVDARERIDGILLSGEVTTLREQRQEQGFFPTPDELASRLVDLAEVRAHHWCLEPSAGTGAIVAPILARGAGVLCIERDRERRTHLLKTFAGKHPKAIVASFVEDFLDFPGEEAGFSGAIYGRADAPDPQLPEVFDRVVMNPPFLKVGRGDHLDHVRHAFSLLSPGGILVSVLSVGVRFREDTRHRTFREWFWEHDHELADLPEDAFRASGTGVRTVALKIWKDQD